MKNYGTKEWFESQFENLDKTGDQWGHRWRGSQKFRYHLYIKVLQNILPTKNKVKILDIGCALGDFTKKVESLDPKNEIFGIDISENAIEWVSKQYSNMRFEVGSLPSLSFEKDHFDIVLCLEVLYYLNQVDRVKSLENIKRILKLDGYFLFSAVLDKGSRYFAEDEIIKMISSYFYIEQIDYNYANIYTIIESRFFLVISYMKLICNISTMEENEFKDWCNEIRNERNNEQIKIIKKMRKILYILPFSGIIKIFYNCSDRFLRSFFSLKFPVILSFYLSKLILGNKGKTHIIILAKKSS